jgi:excisionase family DNA binding protein
LFIRKSLNHLGCRRASSWDLSKKPNKYGAFADLVIDIAACGVRWRALVVIAENKGAQTMAENQRVTAERWETERLVPVDEAAYRLGVSPWTIRWWIQQGRIASNKLGARRLIPVSEIERLIAESRRPARRELQAARAVA